ncbi:helix-turn-helix domain-containing protein [Streptomyces sp. NPDC059785]|uniref:helix-turn-helix domain-containing protein n=1 Tax=unclassified Streptomyces TaxID=2593676 RepID=UPI0036671915
MSNRASQAPNEARVIPLRPAAARPAPAPAPARLPQESRPVRVDQEAPPAPREPLWRDLVGDVLRRERLAQRRTLKDVADAARISLPYLSELERGRKEASSEVLAAAAQALGLGLADLLGLARGELVRLDRVRRTGSRTGRSGATPSASTSRYNGLCLVA